jgi:hypothetical protein
MLGDCRRRRRSQLRWAYYRYVRAYIYVSQRVERATGRDESESIGTNPVITAHSYHGARQWAREPRRGKAGKGRVGRPGKDGLTEAEMRLDDNRAEQPWREKRRLAIRRPVGDSSSLVLSRPRPGSDGESISCTWTADQRLGTTWRIQGQTG